jgi:hypothetical protein
MEVVENVNGKKDSFTIEPADGSMIINNLVLHITIAAVGVGKVVNSVNGKSGDVLLSSDGSISVVDSGNSLELNLTSDGTIIDGILTEINGLITRVDVLEQLGSFIGSFNTYAAVPTNVSGYSVTVSVNDFIHVTNDENHDSNTTQYIIYQIIDDGTIQYLFDIILDSHAVTSVNSKVGDIVLEIADISGLQQEIDDAHFDGNLAGNLVVGGEAAIQGNFYSNATAQMKAVLVTENLVASKNIAGIGDVAISGALTVGGNLTGSSDASISKNFSVGGTTTLNNATTVQGNLTVGTIGKPGDTTIIFHLL